MCVSFRCNFEVSPQFISTSVGLLKANILMAFKLGHTHEHKRKLSTTLLEQKEWLKRKYILGSYTILFQIF